MLRSRPQARLRDVPQTGPRCERPSKHGHGLHEASEVGATCLIGVKMPSEARRPPLREARRPPPSEARRQYEEHGTCVLSESSNIIQNWSST